MKNTLAVQLSGRSKTMLHSLAIVATALDPRFKDLPFLFGIFIYL